jgi:hypothetical protein
MSGLALPLALQDSGPAELVRIGLVDRRGRHTEDEGLLDGCFRITGGSPHAAAPWHRGRCQVARGAEVATHQHQTADQAGPGTMKG